MLASSSLALALLWAAGATMASETPPQRADCYSRRRTTADEDVDASLYQFEFPEIVGNDTVNLEQYRGHVLLLVNVATY